MNRKKEGVLIVDDVSSMRMMLRDILIPHGFKVAGEAKNGEEAVKAYADLSPEIVLMDIIMPKMNGVEAMENIRREDPEAKVIVISALAHRPAIVEAMRKGAADFIVKPFDEDQVLSAVELVREGML